MPKLFTKFHRGTSTAQYDYEGAGIGLYLAKLIVTEHGGEVAVKSDPGKGTTFTVYLPLL
jgi:signal transduction histidine kinase